MNLSAAAYNMPTGMLLHEAGRQFAMAEIVRDSLERCLFERGGWFLLLVHAERTDGVQAVSPEQSQTSNDTEAAADSAAQPQRK